MSELGAFCYANSIFQVLARTPGFIESLKETGRDFCQDDGSSMTGVLYWILDNINKHKDHGDALPLYKDKNVHCFMDAVFKLDKTFEKHLQNDCHSFLISLLNIIKTDNEFLIIKKNPTGIFEGKQQNEFKYTTCDHREASGEEVFLSLLIPTYDHDGEPKSVQDGLKRILEEEAFGYDTLKCRTCKEQKIDTIAIKQTVIIEPPEILILQLARFREVKSCDRKKSSLVKEEGRVRFEEKIYLDATKQIKYTLYGVIIHLGSIEEGHYITYVKSRTVRDGQEKWFRCDGFDVSECQKEIVFDWTKTCAYVLFYHKDK